MIYLWLAYISEIDRQIWFGEFLMDDHLVLSSFIWTEDLYMPWHDIWWRNIGSGTVDWVILQIWVCSIGYSDIYGKEPAQYIRVMVWAPAQSMK